MKSKKLVSIFIILTLLPMLTAGCWDSRELEDQAFVVAIGLDKGKQNQLLVTFRIGIPSKSGLGQAGGGGGGGEGSIAKQASLLTTVAAPTIPAAMVLASGYINRDLNLFHTKAIVIGESFAKDGVRPILSILARFRELRRNIFVSVCKGNAYELLKNNEPDLEKSFSKWWEGVKMMQSTEAIHPGTLFHEFITDVARYDKDPNMIYMAVNKKAKKGDPGQLNPPPSFQKGELGVIAGGIPRKAGNAVEYMGTAVFSGDRLKDVLNMAETASLLMLSGNFRKTFFTVPDPEVKSKFTVIEIKQGAPPRIRVSIKGDHVKIKETLFLEGDLIAIQSQSEYAADAKALAKLNTIVENHIRQQMIALLNKLQQQGLDSVGYGSYAKINFLDNAAWQKFNWKKKYKDSEIILKINFAIRRTGMQGKQPGPVVY